MIAEPVRMAPRPVGGQELPRKDRSARRRAFRLTPRARLAWLGLCVLLLSWTCLGQQASIVERSYQLSRLQAEKEALEQQILRLNLEKAQLASLARIEQVARAELGMVEPGQVRVVRVAPGTPGAAPEPALARLEHQEGSWWERILARILPGDGIAEALEGQRP